jgi:hypothetical protein
MEKKYNYTYQIKNLINDKTYIGVHSTNKLDDGYMGSGYKLKKAFEIYGKENFSKEILCFFDTAKQAYEEEEFLVNCNWIKNKNNYNLCLGGSGGINLSYYKFGDKNPMYGKKHSNQSKELIGLTKLGNKNWLNKAHSKESKELMSLTRINKKLGLGENNPNFKNKISGLPFNICNYNSKKNPFYVRIKGKVIGYYPNLDEAIIARDNYINKINNTLIKTN